MSEQDNLTSAVLGDDSAVNSSFLKQTLVTAGSNNASDRSPGITENLTSLLSASSPAQATNLPISMAERENCTTAGVPSHRGDIMRQTTGRDADGKESSGFDTHPENGRASENPNSSANQPSDGLLQKKYFCKVCDQGFTRKHNMASHELIHSSAKPHVCGVCDSKFRRIHDLKRHEKLHTGEKPYHCSKCTRRFARPDALIRHQNSPNACSGNNQSVTRVSGPSFSLIVPAPSNSPSSISSPTTAPDVVNSDMSRWKSYQHKLHHKLQCQPMYRQVLHLQQNSGNSTTPTPASENDVHQGGGEYLSGFDSRETYAQLQTQYSPKRPNTQYFPYYLSVNNNQHSQTNNSQIHRNTALLHSNTLVTKPNAVPQTTCDGFVTLDKYQDLIAYTRSLQEHITSMDARLKYLEERSFRTAQLDGELISEDQKRADNNDISKP